MKILLYSHHFAPSVGGVESIVLSLARGLTDVHTAEGLNEFHLTLVTETPAQDFEDRLLPFRVVRQPSFPQLLRVILDSDVLHLAGPALTPLLLGLVIGKPIVVEHHGFQSICPTGQLLMEPGGTPCPGHFMTGRHSVCLRCRSDGNWLASGKLWLLTFARRRLCSYVDANIMPTEWLSDLCQLSNAITIPHGIDVEIHNFASQNLSGRPEIIFQGRMVTTKGLPVLLKAACILRAANRAFEILVIGDGPERRAIQELAERLDLSSSVRFAGRIATADLNSLFSNASIVVVPSLAGEVFGLVLAESMSRGLPVVASDIGSFAEILGDAGLRFRTGDANHLAQQIGRLLDDSGLSATLGSRARKRIYERYPRSQMISAHAQLYRRVVGLEQS